MLGDLVDVAVLVFVLVLGILWMSLVGEQSKNLRRQGAGLLVVVLWLWD